MEVICPSYGRTGTNSMKTALEILGFGPCYHMMNVLQKHMGTHPQLWLDGYEGRGLPVKKIFEGYKATTDWPASDFYKEIMQEYPCAKVILTVRDPDAWWKSIIVTIHHSNQSWQTWGLFFIRVLFPKFRRWTIMERNIATLSMGEKEAKADFIRHNEEIKAHVDAEKLLEFSVKEGWEPLCSFLEVPVPDVPFPRTNSAKEIDASSKKMTALGWALMVTTITAAGVCIGVVSLACGERAGAIVAAIEVCALSSCFVKGIRAERFYVRKP